MSKQAKTQGTEPNPADPDKSPIVQADESGDAKQPPVMTQPAVDEEFHYPGGEAQYNADQAAKRKGGA